MAAASTAYKLHTATLASSGGDEHMRGKGSDGLRAPTWTASIGSAWLG